MRFTHYTPPTEPIPTRSAAVGTIKTDDNRVFYVMAAYDTETGTVELTLKPAVVSFHMRLTVAEQDELLTGWFLDRKLAHTRA